MMGYLFWFLIGIGVSSLVWGLWKTFSPSRFSHAQLQDSKLYKISHMMAGEIDNKLVIINILNDNVPEVLGVSQAAVFLTENKYLIDPTGTYSPLPLHNPAVRLVASRGDATLVQNRLARYIEQGQEDLSWSEIWVPLLRGTKLFGIWILSQRERKQKFTESHRVWLRTLAQQAATNLEIRQFAALSQANANELKILYHQAVNAKETERARLSRELHDGALQDLCAISRDLKVEQANLKKSNELPARLDETIDVIRSISHDLRPPFLSNNLILALEPLVERMNEQSGTPVFLETNCKKLIFSEDHTIAIYRIIQESLNNALEHADASEIGVRITQYPDFLRLTVTDDGQGIAHSDNLAQYVSSGHLGLAGMRERAEMINAKLEIQTATDYGTAIILEITNN